MATTHPPTLQYDDVPLSLNHRQAYIEFPHGTAASHVNSVMASLELQPVGGMHGPAQGGGVYTVNHEHAHCRWVMMPPGMTIPMLRAALQQTGVGRVWVNPVYGRPDMKGVLTGLSYAGELAVEVRNDAVSWIAQWVTSEGSPWQLAAAPRQPEAPHLSLVEARPTAMPDALLASLDLARDYPQFAAVQPNWIQLHSALALPSDCAPPNDPLYQDTTAPAGAANQWNLHDLLRPGGFLTGGSANAEYAWNDADGPEVIVAVIDSGCDLDHGDLAGRFVDPAHHLNLTDLTDPTNAQDSLGHGTRVAGIIAAIANNGVGIAGICKPCRLLPIRLNATKVTDHDLMIALKHARTHGARVANLSLVLDAPPLFSRAELANAEAHQLVVVAAAGNAYSPGAVPVRYPAKEASVIAVGAVDKLGCRWQMPNGGPQSSYGSHLDTGAG